MGLGSRGKHPLTAAGPIDTKRGPGDVLKIRSFSLLLPARHEVIPGGLPGEPR